MSAADHPRAGVCVYGDGWAFPAVLIDEIERGTGSAVPVYAHERCAEAHHRVPVDTAALPDPDTLTIDQRRGLACARCRVPMTRSVYLGTVYDRMGPVMLWVCPGCLPQAARLPSL